MNYFMLSLGQLLALANEDFYKNVPTKEDFIAYLKAVGYYTCADNELNPDVKIYDIREIANNVRGLYHIATNKIILNQSIIDLFDKSKKENSLFIPYKMIQTVLHETRHYAQHSCRSNIDEYLKDYAQFAKVYPQCLRAINDDTNPLEIDARYYAYTKIKKYPNLDKYQSHRIYLKSELTKAKSISPVFVSLLKAHDYALKHEEVMDMEHTRVLNDFNISWKKFLTDNNIDISDYGNSLMLYLMHRDLPENSRKRPAAERVIRSAVTPYVKNIEEKILNDEEFPQEELLKCQDCIYKLNSIRLDKSLVFHAIKVKTFYEYETRVLYRTIAPMFSKFKEQINDAPAIPSDELKFSMEM